MDLYRVTLIRTDNFYIDVEAEDEDQALDAAYNKAPYLCAQCSGWGSKDGSVDAGEWTSIEDYGKTVELVEED